LYFPISAKEAWKTILLDPEHDQSEIIILGGGACIESVDRADIIWGAGMTSKKINHPIPPDWVKRCKLAGIRDYIEGYRWVPCVSCMSPTFDVSRPEPIYDVVVFMNYAKPSISDYSIPTLANNCPTMENAISFLSSGKKIITNSYHGIYWSRLLKKDVEIVGAYSSKFYQFKPAFTLEECREVNLAFWEDVRKELNI
jgi:hypothetical protein